MRMSLGIVVTFLSAAGCAPAPDRAQHTVQEYREAPDLRRQELAQCLNDPGTLRTSADCVNAREAERTVSVGSLRELPPLRTAEKR
jgi:hypothetical protein